MDLTSNNKITGIVNNLFMEQLFGEDFAFRQPQSETEHEIFTAEYSRRQKRMDEIHSDSDALVRLGIINCEGQISSILLTQDEADVVVKIMCLMQVYAEES